MSIFTEHPHDMKETYLGHLGCAFKFGALMVIGGVACILHAIFPFIFKDTASNFLLKMTTDFITRQPKLDERSKALLSLLQMKAEK